MEGKHSAVDLKSQFEGSMSPLGKLSAAIRIYDNWYDVLLFRAGIKRRITASLRSGEKFRLAGPADYESLLYSRAYQTQRLKTTGLDEGVRIRKSHLEFDYLGNTIKLHYGGNGTQLAMAIRVMLGNFFGGEYDWLDVSGREVLDIGASIGDTAIYFCIKGARRVVSYEPYPATYATARENIRLNGLEGRVTLINEGCGKKGQMRVSAAGDKTGSSALQKSKEGKMIRIVPLSDAVKKLQRNDNDAILKIDCEGGEYPLISEAKAGELRRFSQIMLEYHSGTGGLIPKLERAGFRIVKVTGKGLGLIYAVREKQ